MFIKEKIPLVFGVPDEAFYDRLSGDKVFVAELRPELSGMTIVSESLLKRHILPVVICDNMMAFCMERGLVSSVNIFYDSVQAGSALCRAGSLIAALCAREHDVPVFLSKGSALTPAAASLLKIAGMKVTTQDIKTYVPMREGVPTDLAKEYM